MMFVGYLGDIWRNLRFPLISSVNFYYVINNFDNRHTNLILIHHLMYCLIDISIFLTIRCKQMNVDSKQYRVTLFLNVGFWKATKYGTASKR
jgi:hypothetical protein